MALSVNGVPVDQVRSRADLLLNCAQMLHCHLDVSAVVTTLASRVQELLAVEMVAVLLRRGDHFVLEALATSDHELSTAIQVAHGEGKFQFAADLAMRAHATGEPVAMPVTAYEPQGSGISAPGHVLAAAMRSEEANGALVVYRSGVVPFTSDERSVLAAVASFGALAISNAELYARANSRTRELQQLLEITSELGTVGNLPGFLAKFVVRAAEFLGFDRSFIALKEEQSCNIRWMAEHGAARPASQHLPEGLELRVLGATDPFWSNDVRQWPGMELGSFAGPQTRQALCVPLLGSNRTVLGVLGLLDRSSGQDITTEDVRRAKSLAGEVAVALQATQGLHGLEERSRHSQLLAEVGLELNSTLQLGEFGERLARRASEILECRGAAVAVAHGSRVELIAVHDPGRRYQFAEQFSLNAMLTDLAGARSEVVVSGEAGTLLGPNAAARFGWSDLTVARMSLADGRVTGYLCLIDRPPLAGAERQFLDALVAQAAIALENARLYTRMDQANRHWMEIFDAITDLIVVHDESLRVLRVNRSLADFIGVAPHELIGVSMRAMIAMAADHGAEACPFCRVVSGGDEYIHPVLDRTYLVSTSRVEGYAQPSNYGQGGGPIAQPSHYGQGGAPGEMQTIHVLKDITDRREAERRYRELFDTIQEGLFFSTPEGHFIEVNEALVRMLGYDCREDLLAVNISEEIYVSPDQREHFRLEIQAHGMVRNYQEVLRRRDGSLVYTLQNAFAVRDAHGQVVQYRGLILDITELKTFQAELQRQRDFNTKILDNTQSMILVVDTAGLISYGNRRCFEAGGYTQDELLGRKLVELVPTPRRSSLAEALSETLAGSQVDNLELPILLGQGRGGQFSINLSPMRDEAGNVNSIVVVMTDITDAAMLQAKLMHTEKMAAVGQLVSGVAHEVNNPLTAVLGFTDLLIDNPEVPEHAKNDLRVVLQEAQRTKQIVQNLLSFARQMPPERQAVQVNVVLRRTLALRSYDLANHGIQIIERMEDGVPEIMGDAHQLQQVFLNILNNAYDAVHETGRQGRIEISTGISNGWAEVTFRDNGHGIAYPERIFDPFFTTKDVGKGTGLGLSICYGIVREHGGEILCRNNGDTPGATFTVRLPVTQSTRATTAAGGKQ
jgi:PAS domain S-box-containing protein